MGMYTEFHFNVELKKDIPFGIVHILMSMLGKEESLILPDHPLFTTPESRWNIMLRGDSYYFAADTHSTLRFDDISNAYVLCIRCNLKNYASDIKNFIDWITPYVDAFEGDFLGFYRCEETETPTVIYMLKED